MTMKHLNVLCVFLIFGGVVAAQSDLGSDDDIRMPPMQVRIDSDPVADAAMEALDEAESDVRNGLLRIRRAGHPSFARGEVADGLKARFGIEIVNDGCVITEVSAAYDAVYNAVMQRAILRRFGKALFALEMEVKQRPNQAPEPTPTSVTPPAAQEPRQP